MMCRYYPQCIGSCLWCASHDYSEACVPMLQAKVKELTEINKKMLGSFYALGELFNDNESEKEDAARGEREKIIDEMAGKLTGRFNINKSAMYSEAVVREMIARVANEMKERK